MAHGDRLSRLHPRPAHQRGRTEPGFQFLKRRYGIAQALAQYLVHGAEGFNQGRIRQVLAGRPDMETGGQIFANGLFQLFDESRPGHAVLGHRGRDPVHIG